MFYKQGVVAVSLLLALLVASPLVQAQQKLVPAQSQIDFVSKQMGVPVEGHFRKFDAQIAFQPTKLDASKIDFTVDMASATLGSAEADAELPKSVWFNTAKFPQASFQSRSFKALGGGRYEVGGKLSIKGSSADVVVPVTLSANGATTLATGAFTVKRLAFRVGENEWADTAMVADDVQVKFKLTLSGVGKL